MPAGISRSRVNEHSSLFVKQYSPPDPERDLHTESLPELNKLLIIALEKKDMENSRKVVDKVVIALKRAGNEESESVATANYLTGVYFLTISDNRARGYLEQALGYKQKLKQFDIRYSRILYNLSVASFYEGDVINQKKYAVRALEMDKKLFGEKNHELLTTYGLLVGACTGLQEYKDAINYGMDAIAIAGNNPAANVIPNLTQIYNGLGITYIHMADYSKARVYFDIEESYYNRYHLAKNENYCALLSNLAIVYGYLGLMDKSYQYYEKGISLSSSLNAPITYGLMNNYALALATSGIPGNKEKGEDIQKRAVIRCGRNTSKDSLMYFSVLFNYAEYLRDMMDKPQEALGYYRQCISYLQKNDRNISLKDPVYLGYALSLAATGDIKGGLEIIQTILFKDIASGENNYSVIHSFNNPEFTNIKPDKLSLKILGSKYSLLWKLFGTTSDTDILKAASETSKLLVGVLEKVRINISEEDSRLILGDRYRNSYINTIRDYSLLYNMTGDQSYLSEAYTYSEKSKVAGLLAAARELNASHFNLPADLSDLESKLKHDMIYLNAGLEDELRKAHPDTVIINRMNDKIFQTTIRRDSLVTLFEKKYPGYYAFKYNSSVVPLKEVPEVVGKEVNYVNYIASDTSLFIFIVNRKFSRILSISTDSSFYSDIREFRKLLRMPSPSGNAREEFERYQATGYRLYSKIVEPLKPYLISDRLLVSPDNILSYIPFETLPTSINSSKNLNYNQIHYLMSDFDISYTYSATFMAETMKRKSNFSNRLIAFAPEYNEPIDIGTVLKSRQLINGILPDLPYARQEAEYVTELTQGRLYESRDAREDVYKRESGQYDIIHLAMHTILNDRDPMYSTLIFSSGKDSTEDRYLKTYEVYSIPLKAKMVVLSSCNSGAGAMNSGEGVLSLARGFMYSGSESVVMALWEIEDRSGTEIVKRFYDNLKLGYSKSASLRRARMRYMKQADQLRSHPYFWSTLVVYGDNRSLYICRYFKWLPVPLAIMLAIFALIYLRRRKYS